MARFQVCMLAACVVTEAAALAGGTGIEMQPVAVHGEEAWDDPGGTFTAVGVPTINQAGVVGFTGRADIDGVQLQGLYRWEAGSGERLAQQGELIGQHPAISYRSFQTPVIDESGQVMFRADYAAVIHTGVMMFGWPGDLRIVAWAGDDGNPDRDYLHGYGPLGPSLLTRNGRLAFYWGQQHVRSLWGGDDGPCVRRLAKPRMPAPGYPDGFTVGSFGWVSATAAGDVVTLGSVSRSGLSERAILVAGDEHREIPVGPRLSPSTPADALWSSPLTPELVYLAAGPPPTANGAGHLGFVAPVVDDEPPGFRNVAFVGPPKTPVIIAVSEESAPGFPEEFTFTLYHSPAVTGSNVAGLFAHVTDGTVFRAGFWRWDGDGLELMFKEGDPILNIPAATFLSLTSGGAPKDVAINSRGEFAFIGVVSLPGGDVVHGLLASDLDGGLHAIALAGQEVEVAPGDRRTIQNVLVHSRHTSGVVFILNGDDGYGSFFNDSGQIAFHAWFQDSSSAIFLARISDSPHRAVVGGDQTVGSGELLQVLRGWGLESRHHAGDIDGSGRVDLDDLLQVLVGWGASR